MQKLARILTALLAVALFSEIAVAQTSVSNDTKYQLNHMNSVTNKVQLGTIIQQLATPSGNLALANGDVFVGNGSGVATAVAPSGDVTMSNAGVFTFSPNHETYTASITVSQADLLAIHSTPKSLLAAPGSGKLIVIDEVEILHTYSTAAYATCGKIQIQYHGSTDIVDLAAAVLTGTTSHTYFAKPSFTEVDNSTGSTPVDLDGQANLGVDFTAATADCTAGNVANIFKVRLKYRVITLLT